MLVRFPNSHCKNIISTYRVEIFLCLFFFLFGIHTNAVAQDPETTPLYYPYAEWGIEYSDYSGNPFDVVATVTFTHTSSNEQITTEMFYDGDWDWETQSKGSEDVFKFRFSGTQLGEWTYTTSSVESALDGITGSIEVVEQSDQNFSRGFIGTGEDIGESGRKWIWTGNDQAFIPNLAMKGYITEYYDGDLTKIDPHITEFIDEHGFNGFHIQLAYLWFGTHVSGGQHSNLSNHDSPILSPDIYTFEILETALDKIYEAGGMIHFWAWGDGSRNQAPHDLSDGVNGEVHQRLQRYISARLGALPGWTMGAGYDLHEDWTGTELEIWRDYYHSKLGWSHIIGARTHQNDQDVTSILTDQLDYVGHEDHANINYNGNIAYDRFIKWLNEYPDKLHFSEDRFRNHSAFDGTSRDFSEDRMRHTLWQSAMAGGIASIWGWAENGNWNEVPNATFTFPNKNEFKIFSDFWKNRFTNGLVRDNTITDGYALKDGNMYIFYKEDASSINMDLTGITIEAAIAVDTKASDYEEIDISSVLNSDNNNNWTAPITSDWVVLINGESDEPSPTPPGSPPTINEVTTTETTATVSYDEVGDAESYDYRLDGGSPVNIGTTNPFEIEGLSTGTSYELQMRSVNSDGTSGWSESTTFTTMAGEQPPNNPPAIGDITTTETTATVSFEEVGDAESYDYRLDGGSPVNIGTSNPFQIENLSTGTSYDLQMRSVNNDGSSDWSETTSLTTEVGEQPPDSPPTIQEVTTSRTTATVSYNEVGDAESYDYRLDSGSPVNIGTTNPFEIEDLSTGTSYDLQMRSVNSDGSSDWSEVTLFTTLPENELIPEGLVLMQNSPNPFNPTTTIRYGIPQESHVVLEVFDMLGKKMQVLVNEQQSAGFHQVVFNALDLSSGTYLYRIQSNENIETKKLTLIK